VARLTVLSSHKARIYLDGKDLHRTTPLRGYKLRPGKHVVTLIHPTTGQTQMRRVSIAAGRRSTLKVQFR